MEKVENRIFDVLYEIRDKELKRNYIIQKGKTEISKKAEKTETELVEFMKKFVKNKKDMEKLFDKINDFESDALDEMCIWYEKYYKLGFIDGMSLERQVIEEKTMHNIPSNKDSFYESIDVIWDYIDVQKHNNLKTNVKYIEISKKLSEKKRKFSKVADFFDNNIISELTQEELKAFLEMKKLYDQRTDIEAEEMYKIGLKHGKSL